MVQITKKVHSQRCPVAVSGIVGGTFGLGQAEAEGQRRHNVDSCRTHSAVRPGASDAAASGSASPQ